MTMVVFCVLKVATCLPQCMACCSRVRVVGSVSPLLDHLIEKAQSIDPMILLRVKGEKNI